MAASQELLDLIANSKTGYQITTAETLQETDYLFVYVSGVGFKKIQKSKIIFAGEPATKLTDLTDTPDTLLGQKGKILVVSQDETTFEYKVLAEVTGVTQEDLDEAIAALEAKIPTSGGSSAPNSILSYSKGYQGGLSYKVYGKWCFGENEFEAFQNILLDAADPVNPRIDIVVFNADGTITTIKGTAAENPSEPDYDPTTQLKAFFVFIPAGATEIGNQAPIYTNNSGTAGGEWDASIATGSGWDLAFDDGGNTKIKGTNLAQGDRLLFTPENPILSGEFTELSLKITNLSPLTNSSLRLLVHGKTSANGNGTNTIYLPELTQFGYDPANITDEQFIAITVPALSIHDIRNLQLWKGGTDPVSILVDDIKFNDGSSPSVGDWASVGYVEKVKAELQEQVDDHEGRIVALETEVTWFTAITENQYGTHPAFTNQNDLNAYILQYIDNGGSPDPEESGTLLYISNPAPRQEITSGNTIAISTVAQSADSVAMSYRKADGTWALIGAAVKSATTGEWELNWDPTEAPTAIKAVATYADATTQESTNLLYGIKLRDTFTDVDNTPILSHTPDEVFGTGWTTPEGGNWEIVTNELQINDADTTGRFPLVCDLGTDNVIFKFRLNDWTASAGIQIILRYDEAQAAGLLILISELNKKFRIFAGSSVIIDRNSTIDLNRDYELRIIDDSLTLMYDNTVEFRIDLPYNQGYTKFGFYRAAEDDTPHFDNAELIPLVLPELTSEVGYTTAISGVNILTKGGLSPYDDGGVHSPDAITIGGTNYMIFTCKNSSNVYTGLSYATAPEADPHNWTRHNGLILEHTTEDVWAHQFCHDGSTFHVVYCDRLTGKIYYASGPDLENLTKHGVIVDKTTENLFFRYPDVIFKDGRFYLYVDVRIDDVTGHNGAVMAASGTDLTALGAFKEVLSTPGFKYDMHDLTVPRVYFDESTGFFELYYGGFSAMDGVDFPHTSLLAVSQHPLGDFVRTSKDPLIGFGISGASRYKDRVYYVENGDITYATLTSV